ncbi:MAG: hypothetical protein ACLTTO_10350 [Lachnospiraceae bacterium]
MAAPGGIGPDGTAGSCRPGKAGSRQHPDEDLQKIVGMWRTITGTDPQGRFRVVLASAVSEI